MMRIDYIFSYKMVCERKCEYRVSGVSWHGSQPKICLFPFAFLKILDRPRGGEVLGSTLQITNNVVLFVLRHRVLQNEKRSGIKT